LNASPISRCVICKIVRGEGGFLESVRVDLAHERDFAIGPLNVRPSTREVERDGERQVIEPRVMQVLVALHRADGAVVSKDDLAHSCWEGRVVGEDAINRVISRLRKLGEGLGKDVFQVETVTRVGYRMLAEGFPTGPTRASGNVPGSTIGRRTIITGVAIALTGAAGGLYWQSRRSPVPNELAMLIDQAETVLTYGNTEQTAAAVGQLQEAARRFPDRAEPWGKLAIAYRRQGVNNPLASGASILDRAEAAARRAVELDADNIDGAVVLALGRGLWYSSYANYDRQTQLTFERFPDHDIARGARSTFLFETGRINESLEVSAPMVAGIRLSPRATGHARKLWSAGRLDEAEALFARLIQRWPRHNGIWNSYLSLLLFSGRLTRAETMVSDMEGWPDDLEEIDIVHLRAQVAAMKSSNPADVDAALAVLAQAVPISLGKAEEAAHFASAAGRLDTVFEYLGLHFFSGELAGKIERSFSARFFRPHSGKLTYFLFEPPMKAARADPRFGELTRRLGLDEYWRNAGVTPDYLG
jgi:DNA-binding winged helix-turn-helix (wHTH) protein/tetratricopeptide (TPR) repeat protein